MPNTTPTHAVVAALVDDYATAEAPSGTYVRVMVGKRAVAWALRLKSGKCRLILRVEGDPPAKLAEGGWKEAKSGHFQVQLGGADVKRGRALIDWAIGKLPSEEQVTAAKKAKASPAKPKRLRVVRDEAPVTS